MKGDELHYLEPFEVGHDKQANVVYNDFSLTLFLFFLDYLFYCFNNTLSIVLVVIFHRRTKHVCLILSKGDCVKLNPLVLVLIFAHISFVDFGDVKSSVLVAVQDIQVTSVSIKHQGHFLQQRLLDSEVYVVLLVTK